MAPRSCSPRSTRIFAFIAGPLFGLALVWYLYPRKWELGVDVPPATPEPPSFPMMSDDAAVEMLGHPTFKNVWNYERELPQHSQFSRVKGGSKKPRYLRIPHASWGSGWNNVFQEQLLNAHLAHLSDRAYVFPEYIPRDHPPFPDTLPNGTRHMLHIPMNAFVSGPVGGGPFSSNPDEDALTRRSVSEEWWNIVCPRHQVKVLNVYKVQGGFGYDPVAVEGAEIMARWAEKLRGIKDVCVSVEETSIFHYVLIGAPWMISAWPSYGSSPVLRNFAWSPLVTAALSHNFHIIAPSSTTAPANLLPFENINPFKSFAPLAASSSPIPGLLGLHVRRGDYEGHCAFLSAMGAGYNAWNNMGIPGLIPNASLASQHWLGIDKSFVWQQLPDYRDVPEGMSTQDALLRHCFPGIDDIVTRAAEVRGKGMLRSIFIATNGDAEWVSQLVQALRADGWESIATSLDLELGPEARAVSQAVDMGILTALAEEFIGVGFSSLSSNVVQIRLGAGMDAGTIHFW
ncbi:hypothetical protein C8F01DRAFT_1325971 [Mycena amicta]|nr:hypothetical protein C8F01DRAFT_1325971 [Mycena amicta]